MSHEEAYGDGSYDVEQEQRQHHFGTEADNEELLDYEGEADNESSLRALHVSAVGRKVPVTVKPKDNVVLLTAHYASRQLQRAPAMAMLKEAVVEQLPANIAAALPQYQIAWSHDSQLKPQVMNARAVLAQPTTLQSLVGDLVNGGCACRTYPDHFKVAISDGVVQQHAPAAVGSHHVRTMDLRVVDSVPLRSLLAKGLNHIPLAAADTRTTLATNIAIAEQFMQRVVHPAAVALGYSIGPSWYETARRSASNWTRHQLSLRQAEPEAVAELTDSIMSDLADLQSKVLICEVDKAANTCCFICPKYAQLLVLLRLEGSSDFQRVNADIDAVAAALQQQLGEVDDKLRGLAQTGRLPIMRIAYKAHKQDYRYLTNASGSLLSPINSLAQSITSRIMESSSGALAELNRAVARFTGTQTQTCIVIQNAQQVVLNLLDRITNDFCADITKCFENIPIDVNEPYSLQEALRRQVKAAFTHQAATRGQQQHLVVKNLTPPFHVEWQHASSGSSAKGRVYLTEETALSILHIAVTNAYVTAGGVVYRQAKGIPMGADYSPDACNLYFMSYESSAVKRMCRLATDANQQRQLCSEWLYCFRMMDDIRMINAPTLASFVRNPDSPGDSNTLGWIYPPCVGIDVTFDVSAGARELVSTQYLDTLTHISTDGTYNVEIYDKQQKLQFEPVHYIARDSNRPLGNSYKMVLGQAYRIAAICSTADLAAKHIGVVLRKMLKRGFARQRLLDTLTAWANADPTVPGKTFDLHAVLRSLTRRHRSWRN